MSKSRSKKQDASNSYKWMMWVFAMMMSLLLIVCIITNKSPQMVLNDIYQYALGKRDKISKNDSQWESFLIKKDSVIDSLMNEVNAMKHSYLPSTGKVRTDNSGLNIRKYPTTESDIVGKVADGSLVKLFYKDNEEQQIGDDTGYWIKIEVDSVSGYVFSSYLDY